MLNSAMPVESHHLYSSPSQDSISSTRTNVLKAASEHASEYLRNVNAQAVAPSPQAVAALEELTGRLPSGSTAPEEVLELLARFGSPATIANSGGRFFGFVNGGCVPAALAAAWLVSAWDQNAALGVQPPVPIALEETALDWVRQMLLLPEGCGGAGGAGGNQGELFR